MSEYKVIFENGTEKIIFAEYYSDLAKIVIDIANRMPNVKIKDVWVKCGKVGL